MVATMFISEHPKNKTKLAILRLTKHTGFADLLSYLIALEENILLHKDGSLSAHFSYTAPDLDSSTDEELDYHAETWRNFINSFGDGFMIETNVITHPLKAQYVAQEFPDVVSALIDDERRAQFREGDYFKTRYYLSITYKPSDKVTSKFKQFAIETDEVSLGYDECLKHFKQILAETIDYLHQRSAKVHALTQDELMTYLYQCITGDDVVLRAPRLGTFIDAYLSQDFMGGFFPMVADNYIAVLNIFDFPAHQYPCLLEMLSYFPICYRWSTRIISLDASTCKSYLKRTERAWSSKAIGIMGVIRESLQMPVKLDQDAERMAESLRDAQTETSAGLMHYGFYLSNLILMHPDKKTLARIAQDMKSAIQSLNFKVRLEYANATEGYLGSLPCHGGYNVRKQLIDTDFMSCALPTSSVYQGESHAPCPLYPDKSPALLLTATRGSRPFWLNLHVQDVGHSLILGPTGKGKTTLVATLMAAHRRYEGSRIIVLDKDASNRQTIKALGGDYYDVMNHDSEFNPLARVDVNSPQAIETALHWLLGICEVQGLLATPKEQSLLREALVRLSHEPQAYKNLNHLTLQAPALREAIAAFNQGQYQQLLNGTDIQIKNMSVMGFEMGALMKHDGAARNLNLPVIQAMFDEFEILFQDRRPTLLILEEAWMYLQHSLFQRKLTDWFKTLRKMNVAVIFVSQDIDDIAKSDSASVIQSSCPTRIYLPNESAMEIKASYQHFGLNDQQINLIRNATPKEDYYLQSPLGNRLFRLDLGEIAKAFLCIDKRDDISAFHRIYDKTNPAWVLQWLNHKGLKDGLNFAKHNYFGDET